MKKFAVRTVEEIAESIDYGLTASARDGGGPRFLRITDLKEDGVDWETVPGCDVEISTSDRYCLESGDIVFARTGATTGKSYLISDPPHGAVFASYLIRVRPRESVLPQYLAHYFRSAGYWRQIENLSEGAAQPGVNATKLGSIQVPVPGIDEQRRIAAILDRTDSLRRKRQGAIRLADEFLRAVFIDMFGDTVANDKGLPVRQLGDVARFYAGNSLPTGEPFDGQTGGFLHIKVGDMNLPGNEADIHVSREWSSSGAGGIIAPEGAILIPKRGGAIATNKKRLLLRPCVLDPNLMAIGPGAELRQEVLLEWFKQFDLSSISSGSAVPQLNKGDLFPLKITVPPLAMQDRFVQVSRKVKSMLARQGEQFSLIQSASAALTSTFLDAGTAND